MGIRTHFYPSHIISPIYLQSDSNNDGEESSFLFNNGSSPFIQPNEVNSFSFEIQIEEENKPENGEELLVAISHLEFFLMSLQGEEEEDEEKEEGNEEFPTSIVSHHSLLHVNTPMYENTLVSQAHPTLSLRKISSDPSEYLILHTHSPHITFDKPEPPPHLVQFSLHRLDLRFNSKEDEIINGKVSFSVDPYSNSSHPDSLFFWWRRSDVIIVNKEDDTEDTDDEEEEKNEMDGSDDDDDDIFRPFPILSHETQPKTRLKLKFIPPHSPFHFPIYVRSLKQGNYKITMTIEYIPYHTVQSPVSVVFHFTVNFSKPFTISSSTSTPMDWMMGLKKEGKQSFLLEDSTYIQHFSIDNLFEKDLIIDEIVVHSRSLLEDEDSSHFQDSHNHQPSYQSTSPNHSHVTDPLSLGMRERFLFSISRIASMDETQNAHEGVRMLWR
ncbi:MAG TPA: hypothetical protein EYO58_08805, partial [Flavobacteriales bacterium]|nr:hypothetical protein [Flavobacteriales bacterium]